jgi:hypothetical protein
MRKPGTRSGQQNKSIHLFCQWMQQALNDAGLNVMATLKHDAEIPWNERLVKELIWRPVQEAMFDKHSTTELNKMEVGDVYEVINRHIAEKHGLHIPFPSEADLRGSDL